MGGQPFGEGSGGDLHVWAIGGPAIGSHFLSIRSLPVVTSYTMTTPSDKDSHVPAPHDLKTNLFKNANNSCPTNLYSWNRLPGWIELGTRCWGMPEIFVVDVI